jgi:hypothetical protein
LPATAKTNITQQSRSTSLILIVANSLPDRRATHDYALADYGFDEEHLFDLFAGYVGLVDAASGTND